MNRIKKGSLVRIDKHPINTEETYNINMSMTSMLGKRYRVEGVSKQRIEINGWVWHIDDIHLLERDKKSTFKFDEKELLVDDSVV